MPPNKAAIVANMTPYPPTSLPATSLPEQGMAVGFGELFSRIVNKNVPVETAINIVYAPVPYAVMMASPKDLHDFAIGFSLTEGIVENATDIRNIEIESVEGGLRLTITLAADRLARHLGRTRALQGRTGCGICGIDDLKHLPSAPVRVKTGGPIQLTAVHRALLALEAGQPLNAATHAVHGAAFAAMNGEILLLREDVGRHNALDKMIGAAVLAGIHPQNGFVLITSRCSFEMVEKAAIFGARCLVAISAPTSLAITRAKHHGMALMAIARKDSAIIFSEPALFAGMDGVEMI